MTKLDELKSRLSEIADEQEALLDECDEEHDGELTDELQAQFDTLDKERVEAEATLKRLEASAAKRAEIRSRQTREGKAPSRRQDAAPRVVGEGHEQDPKHGFTNHSDFLQAVRLAGTTGRIDDRLRPLAAVGSDEQGAYSDPVGGFFVPEALIAGPLMLTPESDPTASLVTQVPMTAPTVKLNARVDKTHTSSVSGGLQFYRRAETDTVGSTRTTYEQVRLDATSLFGVAYVSEELLDASIVSFTSILANGFASQRGMHLLVEKLRGTGAGEPEGVLNANCTVSVAKETGQAAATIVGENLVKMRERCWGYGRAVWLANHDCYPQLATAHLALTSSDVALYTPGNGTDVPDRILGRPVFYSEFCEPVGTAGDIWLAVWSEYLWGTYQRPQSAESMHVRFLEHERTFKFYEMNDGRCWWRTALTPNQSSNTLSPFVNLAVRA